MSMMSIPQSVNPREYIPAKDYISLGWHIIPVSRNKIPLIKGWTERQPELSEFPAGCRFSQVCGEQPDGTFIIGPEFDHKPEDGIDATANFQAFLGKISQTLLEKLHITRSTGGDGYHLRALVSRPVAGSIIRNDAGKKIGDLRSTGGHLIIQQPDKWLHGAPWMMELLTDDETDELLRAINYQVPTSARATDIDWSLVRHWQQHLSSLLRDGLPHLFRVTCEGARILRSLEPARDTSDARFRVIRDLVLHGYEDAQVAALALHFVDFGASTRKGITWLENDIARIIAKLHTKFGQISRPRQTELGLESAPGRPRKRRLEEFCHYLRSRVNGGTNEVWLSQQDIADELGVTKRTVARWEAEARVEGLIERHTTPSRKFGYIVILGDDKTPLACARACANININTTGDTRAVLGGLGVQGEGGAAPFGSTSEQQPPPLYHAVEDAIEASDGITSHKKRRAVLIGFVLATHPDETEPRILGLAEHIRKLRTRRLQDERLQADLAELTLKQLRAKQRGLERRAADCHKAGKPAQGFVFGRLAWFCQKELDKPNRKAAIAKDNRFKAIQQVLGGIG